MGRLRSGEALRDFVLFVLPVYLPFYQALLAESIARVILSLLLALLLLFLVEHKKEILRFLARCLLTDHSAWSLSVTAHQFKTNLFDSHGLLNAPDLSALFQRPPPLLA